MNGRTLVAVNFSSLDGDYSSDASRERDAQNQVINIIDKRCAALFATNLKRQRPCHASFRSASSLHESLQDSGTWPCAYAVSAGKSTALFWNTDIFEAIDEIEGDGGLQFDENTPIERCAFRGLRSASDHRVKFILVACHGPKKASQGISKKERIRHLVEDFKRLSSGLGNLPVIFGGDFNLNHVELQQCFEDAVGCDHEFSGNIETDGSIEYQTNRTSCSRFWMMWHVDHPPSTGLVNYYTFDDRESGKFQDAPCKLHHNPSRVEFGGNALADELTSGQTRLHKAAQGGNTERVRRLLEELIDVNATDSEGCTPLHFAAGSAHVEIVKVLADNGANIEAQDADGSTALHYAASNGHTDTIKALVECGADVDAIDDEHGTALHFAASNGHGETVVALVELGADVDAADDDGSTALHYAAGNNHDTVAEYLCQEGADVDTVDIGGFTALHLAAQEGHVQTVKLLVETCEADVRAENDFGKTPLDLAVDHDHGEVAEFLEQSDSMLPVNPSEVIPRGDHPEDITACDEFGRTALHRAARDGDEERVRHLVRDGADVRAKAINGETALHLAARSGKSRTIVVLVMECGADVHDVDNDGETPLHTAASCGRLEAVKALIEDCGADAGIKDSASKTACQLANQFSYSNVVEYFTERQATSSTGNGEFARDGVDVATDFDELTLNES